MNGIKYIEDKKIDELLDQKLRNLLAVCFTRDPKFKKQRYNHELPQHRWYMKNGEQVIANVALHAKTISTVEGEIKIGGIAEVAVHPDYRGRGYVKIMLRQIHDWLKQSNYPFAMLFGDYKVYSSSGYVNIDNELKYFDTEQKQWRVKKIQSAMICPLAEKKWPEGLINLNGPMF
jgi:predicted acetyltransferase